MAHQAVDSSVVERALEETDSFDQQSFASAGRPDLPVQDEQEAFVSNSISSRIASGDYEYVANWVNSRLQPELPISAKWVKERAMSPKDIHERPRADSTFMLWFKNRLEEDGILLSGSSVDPLKEDVQIARLTVPLHVGFLSVEETPEQLERLRGEISRSPAKEPSVARSKITTSNNPITPINRTAHKVAPDFSDTRRDHS